MTPETAPSHYLITRYSGEHAAARSVVDADTAGEIRTMIFRREAAQMYRAGDNIWDIYAAGVRYRLEPMPEHYDG